VAALGVEKIQNGGHCHGNQGILRFPWQRFQASKPFIHMPYNISIKFHPILSTLNFSRFLWQL
jgi:hypothetical protein